MLKGQISIINNVSGEISSNEKLLNHEYLYNRNIEKAHAIDAIDGLEERLRKIEATEETLSTVISNKELKYADEIVSENARALKAEKALDLQIKQVGEEISSIETAQVEKISKLSEAVTAETLDRVKAEAKLTSHIIEAQKKVEETQQLTNNYAVVASKNLDSLAAKVRTNEVTFEEHLESFNKQSEELKALMEAFENHIKDFENFSKELEESDKTESNLKDLEQRLQQEFYEKLELERQTTLANILELKNNLENSYLKLDEDLRLLISSTNNDTVQLITNKVDELNTRISNVQDTLNSQLENYKKNLDTEISNINSLIDKLDLDHQKVEEDYKLADSNLNNKIKELSTNLESTCTLITERVETLRSKTLVLEGTLGNLSTEFVSFKSAISNEVSNLKKDLTEQIQSLEDSFSDSLQALNNNLATEIELQEEKRLEVTEELKKDISDESQARIRQLNIIEENWQRELSDLEKVQNQHFESLDTFKVNVEDDIEKLQDGLTAEIIERTNQISKISKDTEDNLVAANKYTDTSIEAYKSYTNEQIRPLKEEILRLEKISNVVVFVGVTSTDISPWSKGQKNPEILINGVSYTAKPGDLVIYDSTEYVWTENGDTTRGWEELGNVTALTAEMSRVQKELLKAQKTVTDMETVVNNWSDEMTKAQVEYIKTQETVAGMDNRIANKLIRPESLIFGTYSEALSFVKEPTNSKQLYPGISIYVDNISSLDSYVLTAAMTLQPLMSFSKN